MKYNESNFTYLKVTSLNIYYSDLLKAECACEDFPRMTKIIARKVLEAFIRNVGVSYGIDSETTTGEMIKILRYNKNFDLPEEVYDYIQIVRVNGIGITLYRSRDKRIDKHPIEILELMHRIFCWYLKKNEKESISKFVDISFKAPKTIEYEENELKKIDRDIRLKDNQINNLREKIIQLSLESKSIGELNNIIIAIKDEKEDLTNYRNFIISKINSHRKAVNLIKNDYEREIKEFDLVKDECSENHILLSKRESMLVRAELDRQQLKSIIDELEEDDNIIDEREALVENLLESIRKGYEKSLDLTNKYQDNIETLVFTYNEELKKILNIKKGEIATELSFEDNLFYNKITEYNKAVDDTRKKVTMFKEILDDKIKKSVKYKDFYKAFLNLRGNKLRMLYSMVTNWNKNNINILSKSKEWILNRNNEDSFSNMVIKTMEEVKNISDDQIKLTLYYRILRLSEMPIKNICNRKNFIKAVDSMVQSAYIVLVDTKDFNYYLSKTHSIKVYYLKKVIEKVKSRYKNIKIHENVLFEIYDEIIKLSLKNEIYFSQSLKVDINNEHALKNSIKKQPFEFLTSIIEVGESADYKVVYKIIFEILKEAALNNHDFMGEQLSLDKFLRGSFRIMLFISNADGLNSKLSDEIMPLIVGEILISDSIDFLETTDFESYNRMIEVWKSKQIFYKDKFNEKDDIDNKLEELLKERAHLENNIEKLNQEKELLQQNYASYKDEFKHIVLYSDKSKVLESYERYKECENKIQESANSNLSSEPSIIEAWVEQASKKINESNMSQAETKLIEEAKSSPFFDKEYKVFTDIEDRMTEIENELHNNRKILGQTEQFISSKQEKLNKLNEYLEVIKGIYPDIE